jgi:hypothetical protein
MQITIITEDKTVYVDGFAVQLPDLDWSKFNGDPSTPWDDIRAVQFNSERNQGHVEYKTLATSQVTRPDIAPPNWLITSQDFSEKFAWVLPAYEAGKAQAEAQRAAREAEAMAAVNEQALSAQAPAPEIPANLVTREEAESFARAAADRAVADFAKRLAAETGGV